jgi:hypothetical protein
MAGIAAEAGLELSKIVNSVIARSSCDGAVQSFLSALDCFARLAMTGRATVIYLKSSRSRSSARNLARSRWEPGQPCCVVSTVQSEEDAMGFGRGALLWLVGVPLPIIILLALFMHH